MAGFLKSIFGKKEEIAGSLELGLWEVSAWLDAREQEIHGELDAMVLASRERALVAIATLKAQVGDLASLQPPADQVMSPKLRRVVEQGIPRFIAAMEKTLDTRLSTVPGEYYDDCVGIIAGTTKNMKGPGRYIPSVYPREMKEIRASLDILGVAAPIPLFDPPIDPMALVTAAASGGVDTGALAGAAAAVPHYRFSTVFRRAQELVDKLRQSGAELLSVLERRDAEELGLLQSRQEGVILGLTRGIKEAEVKIAAERLEELRAARTGTVDRIAQLQ